MSNADKIMALASSKHDQFVMTMREHFQANIPKPSVMLLINSMRNKGGESEVIGNLALYGMIDLMQRMESTHEPTN